MAGRRKQDNDRLTDANIARVIQLLNPAEGSTEKPITKKLACEILGITYSGAKLQQVIENYEAKIEREKRFRAEKRGKPASVDEVQSVISDYLKGEPVNTIAKGLYRGTTFVKAILDEYAVPIRQSSHNYFKPELLPEGGMRDRFDIGEIVYSARYDSPAKIISESDHPVWGKVYRVWLLAEEWQQYANTPACELGSLEHIRKLGVVV